jgi:hypothetical protein
VETSGTTYEPPKSSPWVSFVLIVGIFVVFFAVAFNPMPGGIKKAAQIASVQMSHALGLALYSYANDNNQQYPDGANSTEVFQKLLDGGYVTDPAAFYIPMPGKIKLLTTGQKLKPENVCWDVTAPVDLSGTPKNLPVLFMTGYRINYVPGGSATPVIKPFPRFGETESLQSGLARMLGMSSYVYKPSEGIAIFYDTILPASTS